MARKSWPEVRFVPQDQRVCVWCLKTKMSGSFKVERGWVKAFTCTACQPKVRRLEGWKKSR
jgi:hypothetical protein